MKENITIRMNKRDIRLLQIVCSRYNINRTYAIRKAIWRYWLIKLKEEETKNG